MAGLSRDGLKRLALTHAVEIVFVRRDKQRLPRRRRMWMTLDPLLLNSAAGKKILNFRPPKFSPAYNAAAKNLLVVWDIIMQDWRAVPVDAVQVVPGGKTIPTRAVKTPNNLMANKKAQADFWEYFNTVIVKMTPAEKSAFMDK